MQALLVVGTIMQVVGSIQAGNAQAAALQQQSEMYVKQAQIYGAQAQIDQVETDRRVAMEKSAQAAENLQRTQKLQRIIGSTIADGASAGIETNYGSITSLNEYSGYEKSVEEAIANDNSYNRIVSLNLNSAINQQNLANSAQGSVFQAGQMQKQAGQAKLGGYMNAVGSLMTFGMNQYNRGSAPGVNIYDEQTRTWKNA